MARQFKPRPYSQRRLNRNSLLLIISAGGSWYFFQIGWTLCGWFAALYAALCFTDAVWDMRSLDKAMAAKRGKVSKRKWGHPIVLLAIVLVGAVLTYFVTH